MRLIDHPIHPLLVHFPIASWSFAALCDVLTLCGYTQAWPYAWLLLAAGVVTALPAMIAGLLDFRRVGEKALPTGSRHMTLMGTAWMIYLFALLTRSDGLKMLDHVVVQSVLLNGVGFAVMAVGGWYGGQLVYHLGVGVKRSPDDQK